MRPQCTPPLPRLLRWRGAIIPGLHAWCAFSDTPYGEATATGSKDRESIFCCKLQAHARPSLMTPGIQGNCKHTSDQDAGALLTRHISSTCPRDGKAVARLQYSEISDATTAIGGRGFAGREPWLPATLAHPVTGSRTGSSPAKFPRETLKMPGSDRGYFGQDGLRMKLTGVFPMLCIGEMEPFHPAADRMERFPDCLRNSPICKRRATPGFLRVSSSSHRCEPQDTLHFIY